MTPRYKRVASECYEWFFETAAAGETTPRRGSVLRHPTGWLAHCDGHEQGGEGATRAAAVDAAQLAAGYAHIPR